MDKIWTSAKVKIRNRLDFIHYGQRIGYINIVAIVIDLAILLYSAIDYQTLMQTGNLFLFLFLVFTTLIWQTICFVKDFYAYTRKTEYYNLHDMAWRDSDGYCYFVGRNDDVIKCSGYRIGPFEVESALVEHPAVVECAVTAAPDPIRGKVVKATIVLAKGYEGTDALTRELQDHVKKTTAPYKYPRIIEYVDELPKTIGGKIKRKLIRQTDGIQE